MKPHTFTKSQAEKAYGVSIKQGLTSEEAEKRLKNDGKNILSAKKKPSFFKKLLLFDCKSFEDDRIGKLKAERTAAVGQFDLAHCFFRIV